MTVEQIEQLSAVHSQREGGQRLGTADPSPWRYHPELASLAEMQTLTVKLTARDNPEVHTLPHDGPGGSSQKSPAVAERAGSGSAQDPRYSYLTACLTPERHEFYMFHGAEVDEREVVETLLATHSFAGW